MNKSQFLAIWFLGLAIFNKPIIENVPLAILSMVSLILAILCFIFSCIYSEERK